MAKIALVKNIFNPEDRVEAKEIKGGISVREYIQKEGIDLSVYEGECEVYDPDTDTWSVECVSDSGDNPLNVLVVVNKDESTLDYVIKENDDVVITVLPASSDGMSKAATFFGAAAGIFAAVAISVGSGGAGAWIAASIICTVLSATLALAAVPESAKRRKQDQDDEGEQAPTLVGTQNQSLTGNPFPAVMGSLEVTPYVIGSPYNELIVKLDSNGVPTPASLYGAKQKQTLLLAVGYGPLFINDIKLNNMPLSSNPNNILSGILSNDAESDSYNGKAFTQEIGSTYKSNNFRLEISQFGNHRTIYPYSVKQKNLDVALLYCYDSQYEAIATEHQISWQGATFPTGMRTNSVYFSEEMPYKVAVGIEFPKGLYKEYTNDDGEYIYDKIPMHIVAQWRPVYKYTEEADERRGNDDSDAADNIYVKSRDGYTQKRYGAWRNFDNTGDKYWDGQYWRDNETRNIVECVPQVTYTNGYEKRYKKYIDENGNYYEENGRFYYLIGSDTTGSGTVSSWKKEFYANKYSSKSKFESVIYDSIFSTYSKNYKIVKDQYVSCYSTTYTSSAYGSVNSGKVYGEREISSIVSSEAKALADKYFNRQGEYFSGVTRNPDPEEIKDTSTTVAKREIDLNYGLSENTSASSNPNWNGVKCFAFGKYSCGPQATESGDPGQGKVDSMKKLKDAKDSMQFELTATLDHEDILDLIDKNPFSKTIGNQYTQNKAKVITDCIEIRVVRLTPCYIDKIKDQKQHTYSDVVKWNYIKTFSLDKTKLKTDCETVVEEVKVGDSTVSYQKINCVTDGSKSRKGYSYNDWPINEYRSKPLDDMDQQKMVTLAIECEPDKLGYVKDNLKKISVRASAITPNLRTNYIRYWSTSVTSGSHYYYDSYDTEETVSFSHIPPVDYHWVCDTENLYSKATLKAVPDKPEYQYQVMDKAWDSAFFPKVIKHETIIQTRMRPDNNEPETNDNGDILYDTVNYGNSWFRYIKTEMSRHISSKGKWVGLDYFLDAFTKQNAVAQVLGFMCGKALGREAKVYNSLNSDKNIRFWYVNNGKYFYFDSDYITIPSYWYYPKIPTSSNANDWIETTKEYYDTFKIRGSISGGISWGWNTLKSSFNMLSVREAYKYTNQIDFKGEDGPIQWNYNMYLTSQKKLSDVFKEMLVGGLCYWFYDDLGRYEIHNDKPRYNPVLLITDEDCISSSNTREFKKSIGGYHVTFKDEDNSGRQGEIYVLRGDQDLARPTRDILELPLNGITNNKQAWAYGAYMLGQTIVQRESWTRKLNHIGHSLRVGSLVEVQGSTLCIGTDHSGRIQKLIKDDKYIYGFVIDGMYRYRGEYNEDGSNVQGCTLMQSASDYKSRIVTLAFANEAQQKEGVTVEMDGRTYNFKNNVGDTNLVLFEKKIVIDKKSLEEGTGEGISPTYYDPHTGDVVAFGNVGSITSKAVVYEVSYDNKGKVSVSMYPYFESVYYSGGSLPVYQTNLTRKERNGNIPVNENYIDLGLNDFIDETKLNNALATITNGNQNRKPKIPTVKAIYADRDGIAVELIPFQTGSIYDQIKFVKYTITRPNGQKENINATIDFKYMFDRAKDGYPEKDDVGKYRVSFVAVNVYGTESDEYSIPSITTDGYGTWKLQTPNVEVRESDRTATLLLSPAYSQIQVYGDLKYKVSIRKYDKENPEGWYKPDLLSDPWNPDNRDKYKDTEAEKNYETVTNTFIQTLPLKANPDGEGFFDTAYEYRVILFNEAHESEPVVVIATARSTNIIDIVANQKDKVTSEYVEYLSAISANIGVVKQGSITNDDNYWALSDISASQSGGRDYKKGEFKVGDDEQYIQFVPKELTGTGKSRMDIKANLEVDADFANIKGELNVYPLKTTYKQTKDPYVIEGKKYYIRVWNEKLEDYEFIYVENPVTESLDSYWEEDVEKRKAAFQVKPSEVDSTENMTAVNGVFRANDEAIFGWSNLDLSYLAQFLECPVSVIRIVPKD